MIRWYNKILVFLFLILLSIQIPAQIKVNEFEQDIFLPRQKGTVYSILNKISKKVNLFFIYDSKVIDNEHIVKINAGHRKLGDAILEVVGNHNICLEKIGKHILIKSGEARRKEIIKDSINTSYYTIEGRLVDSKSNQPISYGSIGVMGSSIGTISNMDGLFKLIVPEKIASSSSVSFSHLGYEQQSIDFTSLQGRFSNISLNPRILTLPEVVIKSINPMKLMEKMRNNIEKNYYMYPSYITAFYREGVDYNNDFRSLTEAVVKLYKSSHRRSNGDLVHLLKMRKINNYTVKDTLIAKMSSGIDASLKLDVIKDLPDFLHTEENSNLYDYKYKESTTIDGDDVDVVSFRQKNGIFEPRYAGNLYISSEDGALVRVEMLILPEMMKYATDMFVSKQAQSMKLTVQKVNYIINYKKFGKHYFINHVRGDLYFKAKKRRRLFGSSSIHTWFEMLPCKIDTLNVTKFSKDERISPNTVFSETTFDYDKNFWGEYNTIILEQKIEDLIKKLSPKIEVIK